MATTTLNDPHKIFRALAHPARIRIVRELGDGGEKCVCELVEACGLGWSTVSRHISILREAGVVSDTKRGQQVFCRLTLTCVSEFIACLEAPCGCPDFQKQNPQTKKPTCKNP